MSNIADAAALPSEKKNSAVTRFLDTIERLGNKLPDPAVLFLVALGIVAVASALLANVSFTEIDPRTGAPIEITNILTGAKLAGFLSSMVSTFSGFAPLGVVLVAMLGVGVAERSGYINAAIKLMMNVTPKQYLTPMVVLIATISSVATDAGYVLVIPLAAVIFYAAGRHPLAGIAAAFAGVSGGFGANFIPSGLDPLLQSFTQSAAQIIDPEIVINPLNNWFFTSASTLLIVFIGWYITDKIIEPRLANVEVDGDPEQIPTFDEISDNERRAFRISSGVMLAAMAVMVIWAAPADSALRAADGSLTAFSAPLMQSIVPLIFLFFVLPGIVYGFLSGTFKESRDVINAMSQSMGTMSYYIVMAFFCAMFIAGFGQSNIGALLALKGAAALQAMALPTGVTIVGIVYLTAAVNLLVGSSSAKWALIGPIFVPMLMQLNLSPDLVQAAYRVGDSSSNIITPLMPYFPLVVVFAQRYVKKAGIGTMISLMLPYSIALLVIWTLFMLGYWGLDLPLGLQSSYVYPAAG